MSRAVELMIAHVENVTRRRDRHLAELEEAKKMTQQQNSSRNIIDPRASPGSLLYFTVSKGELVWLS